MKKSLLLLLLLSLCSGSAYADASVHKDNYTFTTNAWDFSVEDASSLVSNDTFALTFELDNSLSAEPYMEFNMVLGSGSGSSSPKSFRVTIASSNSQSLIMTPLTLSVTGNMVTPPDGFEVSSLTDCQYLIVQVAENVSLSYYSSTTRTITTLLTAPLGNGIPDTIGNASLRFSATNTTASNLISWAGVVTAEDINDYKNYSKYWVDSNVEKSLSDIIADTANYKDKVTRTFAMNGGKLIVDSALPQNVVISTTVTGAGGKVEITENNELFRSNLSAEAGKEIELSGAGDYHLETGLSLGEGIVLGAAWEGTVYTGSIAAGSAINVNELGNSNSSVWLGNRPINRSNSTDTILETLTANKVNKTVTPGSLTLQKGESTAQNLEVQGMLTLGTATSSANLTASGIVTLRGLTFGHADSTMKAQSLAGVTTLDVQLDKTLLSGKSTGDTLTLIQVTDSFAGDLLWNSSETEKVRSADNRQQYTMAWNEDGTILTLTIMGTENYVAEQVNPTTNSGQAGTALLKDVFLNDVPEAGSALETILNAVDAGILRDRDASAVAGASTAVLGQALSGDTDRQLRAIRNRAISGPKGSDTITVAISDAKGATVSASQPATFSVWVNAEGNRAEQDADGTAAGYTLSSWGGTLGASMQVTPQLTLGLALTAMRGDLKSDGPDYLKGDMDTAYLSGFAHYQRGAWSHSFIGTVGDMEADYKRTALGYSNDGDTDGTAIGLMYELSREYTLTSKNSISPVFNVSYRHTEVDGYSERNTNAALSVDEQSLDTVTMGLGARYAATVGQRTMNRACAFEARALAKYDLGDRQTDTTVGFIGQAARANIESAEYGAFGLELGAGIAVPVGPGSVFADGSVELRSDYTNFNAAAGYRIQF